MTRRAHQQVSMVKLLGLLGCLILSGGGVFWLMKSSGTYRTTEKLNPSDYLENANSLRGNSYQIEGTVGHALGLNPGKGRLFSLVVREANQDWALPIFIPHDLKSLNIQKNQTYIARVRVNDQGILCVTEMEKP